MLNMRNRRGGVLWATAVAATVLAALHTYAGMHRRHGELHGSNG